MSTQLEFIMQLYMMNLLQQQQQQQQFIQNLSPAKQKDNSNNTTTTPTTTTTATNNANATAIYLEQFKAQKSQQYHQLMQPQQQQQQQQPIEHKHQKQRKTRMQKRQNSQNTNCSSSRSCSPNSNSSPILSNNFVNSQLQALQLRQHQQQSALSLNNFPPLTQLMLQQQQQQNQQQLITPSNLLLTPITPNSQEMKANILTDYGLSGSAGENTSNGSSCSHQYALPFQHTSPNVANISFTAQNFLQSSTVTSTPTEEKSALHHIGQSDVDADADGSSALTQHISMIGDGGGVGAGAGGGSDDDEDNNCERNGQHNDNDDDDDDVVEPKLTSNGINRRKALENDEEEDLDEDDLPLSSLQTSSSGIVSSCTTSGGESSGKLLQSSGLRCLESSTTLDDTSGMDSLTQLPYTPIKQEADSSLSCSSSTQPLISLCQQQSKTPASTTMHEDSNTTPLGLAATAILTPPSSEQLITNPYGESGQTASLTPTPNMANLNLTTASSLDAFLQNEENLKNLKKYSSYLECDNPLCRQENLREHFHCFDEPCQGKILSKKDDIIRHLKWHKKRKESLQLGFARFSASDDCAPAYGVGCAYNWKQTHYHCVYEECPKVYVSTSDVQMHANFHRKNSEIVQEGFRRFRAHENCKIEDCPFFGKKISHYHCCREGCNHTFKNKADMDKHKSYHLKDYQLTQDGFKKILKTEICPFEECKFSTVCNHIHCVRSNCNYILHSSSQMISHKRKHDRADGEQAYQNFKKLQKESSEDESPTTTQQQQQQQPISLVANCASNNVSTPLSSHTSTEQFLSRKRGRPPKMIQLPADSSNSDSKHFKFETQSDYQQQQQQQQQLLNLANSMPSAAAAANMFSPFLPNFNPAAAAAMQQSIQSQDPNAPNFQLTHLMALFQLQNPLFYQNLYPGGMAGMLAAGTLPPNASMFGNLAAFNVAAAAAVAAPHIKTEFSDKQQFKE